MVKVLLTGANGFIAAHILKYLLEREYEVVGTVRNAAKASQLEALYPSYVSNGKLSFALVSEISVPGCWDSTIKSQNFDYVIHTASPYTPGVSGKELLDPAIEGTKGILESIKAYGSTVKRVVITGNFAAVLDTSKGTFPGKTYTEDDWSPLTYEGAISSGVWMTTYMASKKLADKVVWEFIEKAKPPFSVAVLAPPMVLGPVVHPITSLESANQSTIYIHNLINGKLNDVPDNSFWAYVDVRDTALAHVLAIEKPEAGNERIIVSQGSFSFQMIVNVIRKNFPGLVAQGKVPTVDHKEKDGFPAEGVYDVDNSKSKRLLGIQYTTFEQTIVDTVNCLLDLEKKLGA